MLDHQDSRGSAAQQPPSRRRRLDRLGALAPLLVAMAIAGCIQAASILWAAIFLVMGLLLTIVAWRKRTPTPTGPLCSWEEVQEGLDRELRRATRRQRLCGAPGRLWSARRREAGGLTRRRTFHLHPRSQ